MRFFLDNCISYALAPALTALSAVEDGHVAVALREKFPEAEQDEDWLPALAAEGDWVVISGDSRIYRNPQRRKIWQQAGLTSFFWQPAWNNQRFWPKAWRMVRWWPDITHMASIVEVGSGFSIPFGIHRRLKPI